VTTPHAKQIQKYATNVSVYYDLVHSNIHHYDKFEKQKPN